MDIKLINLKMAEENYMSLDKATGQNDEKGNNEPQLSQNPVPQSEDIQMPQPQIEELDQDLRKKRLRNQIILIIWWLLNIPLKIYIYFEYISPNNDGVFWDILLDVPILMILICLITARGEKEKDANIGAVCAITLVFNLIFGYLAHSFDNAFLIGAYMYKLITLLITALYNGSSLIKFKSRN